MHACITSEPHGCPTLQDCGGTVADTFHRHVTHVVSCAVGAQHAQHAQHAAGMLLQATRAWPGAPLWFCTQELHEFGVLVGDPHG